MSCHCISTKTLKIFKLTISCIDKDTEQLKLSCTDGTKAKWNNHFGKQFGDFK